mmetsp:Transcript_7291/g.14389  ORF Transcript_7291/g.14389 Transcript_7291/m.14389 type:complete len:234 (-) Transcript_7291:36-737(-)
MHAVLSLPSLPPPPASASSAPPPPPAGGYGVMSKEDDTEEDLEGATGIPGRIAEAYAKVDGMMSETPGDCGTTVAVAVVREARGGGVEVYASNLGDSRVVLCKAGGEFQRLTEDHRASTNKAEVERVKKAGGFVFRNRVSGTLAVTRALGHEVDRELISNTPHISKTALSPSDVAIVVATDGVWDTVPEAEAARIVEGARMGGKSPTEAAEALKDYALGKYCRDNICAVVIYL